MLLFGTSPARILDRSPDIVFSWLASIIQLTTGQIRKGENRPLSNPHSLAIYGQFSTVVKGWPIVNYVPGPRKDALPRHFTTSAGLPSCITSIMALPWADSHSRNLLPKGTYISHYVPACASLLRATQLRHACRLCEAKQRLLRDTTLQQNYGQTEPQTLRKTDDHNQR
jgi:hypothetical protein